MPYYTSALQSTKTFKQCVVLRVVIVLLNGQFSSKCLDEHLWEKQGLCVSIWYTLGMQVFERSTLINVLQSVLTGIALPLVSAG